jgi:hypothetical protein
MLKHFPSTRFILMACCVSMLNQLHRNIAWKSDCKSRKRGKINVANMKKFPNIYRKGNNYRKHISSCLVSWQKLELETSWRRTLITNHYTSVLEFFLIISAWNCLFLCRLQVKLWRKILIASCLQSPCHTSGGYSPASHRGGPIWSPCKVMWELWWTKWHWGRFSPSTSVFLPIRIPPIAPQSSISIIWGWYNRANSGRSTKGAQSHPMRKIIKNHVFKFVM